jgi:DNA polymerase-3 subunit epsilon
LLDAEILADVYLAMTGGQTDLALETDSNPARDLAERRKGDGAERSRLAVLKATSAELAAHEARLLAIDQLSDGGSLWKRLSETPD